MTCPKMLQDIILERIELRDPSGARLALRGDIPIAAQIAPTVFHDRPVARAMLRMLRPCLDKTETSIRSSASNIGPSHWSDQG